MTDQANSPQDAPVPEWVKHEKQAVDTDVSDASKAPAEGSEAPAEGTAETEDAGTEG